MNIHERSLVAVGTRISTCIIGELRGAKPINESTATAKQNAGSSQQG